MQSCSFIHVFVVGPAEFIKIEMEFGQLFLFGMRLTY